MTSEEKAKPSVVGIDPWGLRRIERLLVSLDGVGSIKIVPDGHGGIDEIHVVSGSTSLGPKQIVRNIESALLAEFGLQIDHRKISIARVRGPEIEAAPLEPAAAVPAAHRRLVLEELRIERSAGEQVACRVRVRNGEDVMVGEAAGPDFESSRLETAAAAVLDALQQSLGERVTLALQGLSRFEAFGRAFVAVSVNGMEGRQSTSLAGIGRIQDSPEEAAVLACLHATNRWTGTR